MLGGLILLISVELSDKLLMRVVVQFFAYRKLKRRLLTLLTLKNWPLKGLILSPSLPLWGLNQAISTFGELDWWYDTDPLKGRVLARVWYKDLDSVPQCIVWEQPNAPNGQSWTIFVYTLNGVF